MGLNRGAGQSDPVNWQNLAFVPFNLSVGTRSRSPSRFRERRLFRSLWRSAQLGQITTFLAHAQRPVSNGRVIVVAAGEQEAILSALSGLPPKPATPQASDSHGWQSTFRKFYPGD